MLIAIHLTNFDLFGDEAQYWLWSNVPDLGYYSKPPLLAWILSLYTYLFGSNFETLKYLPVIFYFLNSYVVYLLSYENLKKKDLAIISALSFYLLPSVSISSFLLSTDIVLIFFCSLSLLFLLKFRKKPNIKNIVILGILFGLSFLAKYAAIYYILSLLLIVLFDKKLRKNTTFFNFLIFLIVFIIVFFPNILWNIQNDWITLSHTSDNAGLTRVKPNFVGGFEFLSSQIFMLGPMLFFIFIYNIKKIKFTFETKFLIIFSLPVFFIVMVESVLVRANANWAAVGFVPIFLLIISHVYIYSRKLIIYNNILCLVFCLILFSLIGSSSQLKVFDRISGISEFSEKIATKYFKKINYLIVEDRLLYSSLSYYLKDKNIKILTPHKPDKGIKSHFQLSSPLKPKHNINFIYIGDPSSINYLEQEFKINKREQINAKFINQPINIYEVVF